MERMKRRMLTEEQVGRFASGTADGKFDLSILPEPYYLMQPGGVIVRLYPVGDVLAAITRQGLDRLQSSNQLNTFGDTEDMLG